MAKSHTIYWNVFRMMVYLFSYFIDGKILYILNQFFYTPTLAKSSKACYVTVGNTCSSLFFSETNQDITMKLCEYVEPYQHFFWLHFQQHWKKLIKTLQWSFVNMLNNINISSDYIVKNIKKNLSRYYNETFWIGWTI